MASLPARAIRYPFGGTFQRENKRICVIASVFALIWSFLFQRKIAVIGIALVATMVWRFPSSVEDINRTFSPHRHRQPRPTIV